MFQDLRCFKEAMKEIAPPFDNHSYQQLIQGEWPEFASPLAPLPFPLPELVHIGSPSR
jgi:hypothetical protein